MSTQLLIDCIIPIRRNPRLHVHYWSWKL